MNAVQVLNCKIEVKELDGQRVLTLKDIDYLHSRIPGTAARNFRENREKFIEDIDYIVVTPDKFQSDEIRRFGIESPRGGLLITESGYLMLVKSFTDELAWKVQRAIINNYFRAKQIVNSNDPLQLALALNKQLAAVLEESMKAKEELAAVRDEVNDLKQGLVDINEPLRKQFNSAVNKYRKRAGIGYNEAYNNVYKLLESQHRISIQRRLENRWASGNKNARPIDIVEELNLLVPAIRLAKSLSGE